MWKSILITSLVVLLLNHGIVAWTQTQESMLDEEDQQIRESLFLKNTQIFKKYIEEYNEMSAHQIYRNFMDQKNTDLKIFMLRAIAKKSWTDPAVLQTFSEGILSGLELVGPASIDLWRVRAAACFTIETVADSIPKDQKASLAPIILQLFHYETEDRAKGMAALALVALFQSEDEKAHLFLTKPQLLQLLHYNLARTGSKQQFLCWALIRALGKLKSPDSLIPILEKRQSGFNLKVELEIIRSLNAITD